MTTNTGHSARWTRTRTQPPAYQPENALWWAGVKAARLGLPVPPDAPEVWVEGWLAAKLNPPREWGSTETLH